MKVRKIGKAAYGDGAYLCRRMNEKRIERMEKETTLNDYRECVNEVVDYVNCHLGDEIDLKQLAAVSHFSPFHFHRIMRAFLGEPIGMFIVRKRAELAAQLLRYTDLPVQAIAWRVGYSSPSSLSKIFRQCYAISPLEYRNNKDFTIMKQEIICPELDLHGEVKTVPARNVIYIRLTGDYQQNDYHGTWRRLWQFVRERGLRVSCPVPYCIYYDDPKVTAADKLRTDACLEVESPVTPEGEIGFRVLPRGRYATFVYRGPYSGLQAVYDTIYARHLPAMGCRLRDEASSERYINNPDCTAPEELLTEIFIPVE